MKYLIILLLLCSCQTEDLTNKFIQPIFDNSCLEIDSISIVPKDTLLCMDIYGIIYQNTYHYAGFKISHFKYNVLSIPFEANKGTFPSQKDTLDIKLTSDITSNYNPIILYNNDTLLINGWVQLFPYYRQP